MEENLKEISSSLNIGLSTLYKWREKRKELYKIIVENYRKNSIIENKKESEIEIYFNQLNDLEKEMYLSEIKARVLRKKLDN